MIATEIPVVDKIPSMTNSRLWATERNFPRYLLLGIYLTATSAVSGTPCRTTSTPNYGVRVDDASLNPKAYRTVLTNPS